MGTAVGGTRTFDATAQVGTTSWTLPQGWYRIAMYFDDGYALLAVSQPFRVIKATLR